MSSNSTPSAGGRPAGLAAWLNVYGPALWAAVVLLGALWFFLLSNDIHYVGRAGRLGPAWWPKMILIALMLLAALDLAVELRSSGARAAALAARRAAAETPRVWWLMALGLAATLAYVNLATVIGFTLANFLFMLTFMLLGGFTRRISALAISALGTIALMALFVRVVYVSLPLGIGPFEGFSLLIYSLLGVA